MNKIEILQPILLIIRLFQETYLKLILKDRDLVGFRYMSECQYFKDDRIISVAIVQMILKYKLGLS